MGADDLPQLKATVSGVFRALGGTPHQCDQLIIRVIILAWIACAAVL